MKYLFEKRELNMRQRRWIEFFKDYNFTFKCHPSRTNVVVDVLNRKPHYIASMMLKEYELIEQMRDLNLSTHIRSRSLKMSKVRI